MNSFSRICGMADSIEYNYPQSTNSAQPADPYMFIRRIQQSFLQHPNLRERISNPKDEEQQRASQEFRNLVREQLGQYLFENHFQELLSHGHFSVVRLKKMHHIDCYSNPTDNYARFFEDLSKVSEQEGSMLLRDSRYFNNILSFLDVTNRQIAYNVLSQGEVRIEDSIRASRDDRPALRSLLSSIAPADLPLIREEYQRKYRSSLDQLAS